MVEKRTRLGERSIFDNGSTRYINIPQDAREDFDFPSQGTLSVSYDEEEHALVYRPAEEGDSEETA